VGASTHDAQVPLPMAILVNQSSSQQLLHEPVQHIAGNGILFEKVQHAEEQQARFPWRLTFFGCMMNAWTCTAQHATGSR
jgi:hypothetical protein